MRREYDVKIVVNKTKITKVIIDPHYEDKHAESIDDQIILELVNRLDGKSFQPESVKSPYSYYVAEKMELNNKPYKLIWLLEDNKMYIGIINAYRRS